MLKKFSFYIPFILLCVLAYPAHHLKRVGINDQQDIYYIYQEAKTVAKGGNPYLRTLEGDMRHNNKYSTYFPLFYQMGALAIGLGLEEYAEWLHFWQFVFFLALLACGLIIYDASLRSRGWLIATLFTAFFMLNRWVIYVSFVSHIDFLAVGLMLAGVVLWPKKAWLAMLLFGISLAIKQIAIFIIPLFIIGIFMQYTKRQTRIKLLAWMAVVPLLSSLSFMLWNLKAFIYSVLFSATRMPGSHGKIHSYDDLMGMVGITAKLPMLIVMGLIFWAYAKKTFGLATSAFLVMMTFCGFNSVFFKQYPIWYLALLPICLLEVLPKKQDQKLP